MGLGGLRRLRGRRPRTARPVGARFRRQRAPAAIPEDYREALGARVYGCDICQDVCPWNRGIEKRRSGVSAPSEAEPTVSLVEWLESDGEELVRRYERLYVPKKDPRYLRRNALVALGNVGRPEDATLAERYAQDDDPLVREHAEWALHRLAQRRRRHDEGAEVPASPAPERET